jgi:hypothetical protein
MTHNSHASKVAEFVGTTVALDAETTGLSIHAANTRTLLFVLARPSTSGTYGGRRVMGSAKPS